MGTLNQTTGLHPVITEAQAPVPRGAAGARAQGSWLPASTRTSRFLFTYLVSAPDGRRVSQLRTVCKATEAGRLQRSFKPETGLVTSLLSCSLGKNGFRQSPLSPTPAPSSAACSLKDPRILWFRVKPARGLRCKIREMPLQVRLPSSSGSECLFERAPRLPASLSLAPASAEVTFPRLSFPLLGLSNMLKAHPCSEKTTTAVWPSCLPFRAPIQR